MPSLLRQNSELRKDGIWSWSLPAWVTQLPDGRNVNVCPQAGACAKTCYALNGSYRFPVVKAAHQRNLLATMDTLDEWAERMAAELHTKRFRQTGIPRLPDLDRSHLCPEVAGLLDAGAAAVRIHDAGDFYSAEYLRAWADIAARTPEVLFYSYTKSVSMVREVSAISALPPNFLLVYSLGGREDHLLDLEHDRHADVFPDAQAIADAGYYDQSANDLLCVVAPSNRIGIPMNHIPKFIKTAAGRTFSQMEADTRRRRVPPVFGQLTPAA